MKRTSMVGLGSLLAFAAMMVFTFQHQARAAEKFSTGDKELVDQALSGLRMGMESGKLAKDRANHKVVKEHAADVVRNDQRLWDELRDIAKKHNYDAEDDLHKNDTKMKSQLKELEGQDFDNRFVKMSMHEHQQLISTFRKGASDADASDLKSYFDKNEKIVRANLDAAKELNDKMEKDDSNKK